MQPFLSKTGAACREALRMEGMRTVSSPLEVALAIWKAMAAVAVSLGGVWIKNVLWTVCCTAPPCTSCVSGIPLSCMLSSAHQLGGRASFKYQPPFACQQGYTRMDPPILRAPMAGLLICCT